MAAANGGRLFGGIFTAYAKNMGCLTEPSMMLQVRGYAARKGTREKARKSKVKVEIKKVGFIPHNQRYKYKDARALVSKWTNDSWKSISPDNVWVAKYYRWKVYPFADAIQCHREFHDPTVYDLPNAPLIAYVELNMQGPKKTRFVERFIRTVDIPHPFKQETEKDILALCKGEEIQTLATQAGATLVGGHEIIKEIMAGSVSLSNFDVVIAHPNILAELVALRGLLKKKYPNMRDGTLNADIVSAVKKFVDGVEYKAERDEREQDFGTVKAPIGTLDMDPKHLEENFVALLNDINVKKPKRPGSFIVKTLLISPPSLERLKIDFEQYITSTDEKEDDEDDDDENEPQAATSSN